MHVSLSDKYRASQLLLFVTFMFCPLKVFYNKWHDVFQLMWIYVCFVKVVMSSGFFVASYLRVRFTLVNHHLHRELWTHLCAHNSAEKPHDWWEDSENLLSTKTAGWCWNFSSPSSEENTACQHQRAALTRLKDEGRFEQQKRINLRREDGSSSFSSFQNINWKMKYIYMIYKTS